MRIHSSTPYLLDKWLDIFMFYQNDCYMYHEFTNMAAKKTHIGHDLTPSRTSHLMIGFWPRHLWPRTNVHVRRCPEPPNRPGQVCRSMQKKMKRYEKFSILKCCSQSQWMFMSYLPSMEMSWISDHFVRLPNSETTNQQLLSLRSFCCTSFFYFWSDQWPTTSSCSHHSSMDSFQDQSGVLYIPESFPLNSKPRWQEVLGYLIKVIELRMSCPPTFWGSSYMALSKLRKRNQESQKKFLVTW